MSIMSVTLTLIDAHTYESKHGTPLMSVNVVRPSNKGYTLEICAFFEYTEYVI